MDDKMMRALEADGEKLRQLTGEDHGPWMVPLRCDGCGKFWSILDLDTDAKCPCCGSDQVFNAE